MNFLKIKLFLISVIALPTFANVEPIDQVWEPVGNFPREEFVKIAMVAVSPLGVAPLTQNRNRVESYKQRNRNLLARYIREAAEAGAEIVITPEFGVVGYPDQPHLPDAEDNFANPDEVRPYAEESDGASFQFFSALSDELDVYIHYGIVTPGAGPNDFHNTVQVTGPEGELEAEYHKFNLFELENNYLIPGAVGETYQSPAGIVGLIICADVYSYTALNWYWGVDLLALSTSWARYNTGMSTFRWAARRLGVHLAAANHTYYPDSGMINPDGTYQSHIRQSSGVAYGYMPRVD